MKNSIEVGKKSIKLTLAFWLFELTILGLTISGILYLFNLIGWL